MEPEEDPCGAAVREVFEEVTVSPAAISEGPRSFFCHLKSCQRSSVHIRVSLGFHVPLHTQSETPRGWECRCGSLHHVSQLNLAPGWIRLCLFAEPFSPRCHAPSVGQSDTCEVCREGEEGRRERCHMS